MADGGGVVDGLFVSIDVEPRVRFGGRRGVSEAAAATAESLANFLSSSFWVIDLTDGTMTADADAGVGGNGVAAALPPLAACVVLGVWLLPALGVGLLLTALTADDADDDADGLGVDARVPTDERTWTAVDLAMDCGWGVAVRAAKKCTFTRL